MEDTSDNAQKIGECLKLADYIYENNGTFDNLKSQIQVI
jgi:dephospho-CoA kinase